MEVGKVPLRRTFRVILRWSGRLVLLTMIGVTVAFAVMFYADSREAPWMPGGRWLALIAFTLVVFGIVAYQSSYRRTRLFWTYLCGFLGLHVLAFAFILNSVSEWRAVWFGLLVMLEVPLLDALLDSLLARRSNNRLPR